MVTTNTTLSIALCSSTPVFVCEVTGKREAIIGWREYLLIISAVMVV